jgi:hypothetical protein
MRFQTPQFIEVEDKIFGPLTLKQFLYLAGGGATCFLLWRFIPWMPVAVFLMIPVAAFAGALAFYKVNNKPFIYAVESAFKYWWHEKLYIWKKEPKMIKERPENDTSDPSAFIPRLSNSKLRDLTWSLDVKSNIGVDKNPQQ